MGNCRRGRAGHALQETTIIGERYLHPDGFAFVVGNQRVGAARGAIDLGAVGQPYV